eukprot:scaffold169014_cov31-Prasinocladus_malaysianus.AAC.1
MLWLTIQFNSAYSAIPLPNGPRWYEPRGESSGTFLVRTDVKPSTSTSTDDLRDVDDISDDPRVLVR